MLFNRKALTSLHYTLKSQQFIIFAGGALNNLAADIFDVSSTLR